MLARAAKHALATKPSRPPFRFRGCIYHRLITGIPSRPLSSRVAPTIAAPPSVDDLELVSVFDQPSSSHRPSSFSQTGLFGEDALKTPATFRALADATLNRASLITDRILRARESRRELSRVVKNLDRLSDMLCGIIDLAELVRNAHPDRAWIECADDVYDKLCEYMNTLNVNVRLYEVLRDVLNDPEIVNSLSEEARQTALIFWRDFEKHGIHLPDAERQAVVDTSQAILALGRQFLTDSGSGRPPATIKPSELEGMKDSHQGAKLQLQARFSKRDLLVYPGSLQAQMIMRSAPAEEPRRKVYVAANSSAPQQLEVLEYLLRARAQLAKLLGQDSYARVTLSDKMAKSPENVVSFLETLMEHTKPHARSALRTLSQRKQAHLGLTQLPVIQAWDRDYYCPPEPPAPPFSLPPLTLGTVFMGLSRLFQHLYGISLRPAPLQAGEAWHSDVRKLEVVDEDAGVVGWIYADLFTRAGKPGGAAHYTVRCSRRVDNDETGADYGVGQHTETEDSAVEFGRSQRRTLRGQQGTFQLPVVVLLCDFARPTVSRGATVIEWHDVTTLFHEMGHAMHSMIGRTEYQNVSGTRCATDVVELPSILMEHFLSSPAVLSLFSTDSSRTVTQVGNHHQDPCRAIDTHTQILIAMLDQLYHSPTALEPNFDSTAALAGLQTRRGLIPHVEGTSWQTQFGHLFGYGATYYSYLFDRAIAARVWRDVFAHDPLSRKAGERYKRELLKFGGGRDPWQMVAGLLEMPELAAGDAEAMREVGRWRIEDEVSFGRH